jgi:hypothetical protein
MIRSPLKPRFPASINVLPVNFFVLNGQNACVGAGVERNESVSRAIATRDDTPRLKKDMVLELSWQGEEMQGGSNEVTLFGSVVVAK